MISFTIPGEPCSKANSRRLVYLKGKARFIKSHKALQYETAARLLIPTAAKMMLEGPVRVTMRLFYASERPDLDESVVLDVLQAQCAGTGNRRKVVRKGVIFNDRQVREKHVYWGLDKANPRAEIIIEPMQWQQSDLVGSAAA